MNNLRYRVGYWATLVIVGGLGLATCAAAAYVIALLLMPFVPVGPGP